MLIDEARCTKCGLVKNKRYFYAYAARKSGVRSHCRSCDQIIARKSSAEYRARNKDLLRSKRASRSVAAKAARRSASLPFQVSVDFVLADRIIDCWEKEIYPARMHASHGTAWVAFCSFRSRHPDNKVPSSSLGWFKRIEEFGVSRGWPVLTVEDVISKLDTVEYVENKLLEDWSVNV